MVLLFPSCCLRVCTRQGICTAKARHGLLFLRNELVLPTRDCSLDVELIPDSPEKQLYVWRLVVQQIFHFQPESLVSCSLSPVAVVAVLLAVVGWLGLLQHSEWCSHRSNLADRARTAHFAISSFFLYFGLYIQCKTTETDLWILFFCSFRIKAVFSGLRQWGEFLDCFFSGPSRGLTDCLS